MKTFDQWMDAYAVDHQNKTNQLIHKFCVPLIMFSVLGLLWSLPVPSVLLEYRGVNWASIVCLLALIFYFSLNRYYFTIMLFVSVAMLSGVHYVAQTGQLVMSSVVIFILAWIGQFWGHKIEGRKPSFLTDVQFLLIGPLWVVKSLHK